MTNSVGQDCAYLAKLLLSTDYKVLGTCRRVSSFDFWRIGKLGGAGHLVEYDMTGLGCHIHLLQTTDATEVDKLAARGFVGVSFDQPVTTAEITALGPANLLEAIRFYQAGFSF